MYCLFFLQERPEHSRELEEVHSGRCQCLPPHPFRGETRFNNNALSLLTSHPVSTDPSVSIPAHPPHPPPPRRHFPALPLTFRAGGSDCLAAPAHPPRPAESNNAATQPPRNPLPPPPPRPASPPPPRPVTCLGGVRQVVAAAREVSELPTAEAQDAGVARLLQGPVQAPHGVLRLQAPRVPLRPVGERLTEKSRYRDGHHQGPAAAAASHSGSATSPSGPTTATATSTSTTTAAPTVTTTSLTRRHVPGRENSPRQYSEPVPRV